MDVTLDRVAQGGMDVTLDRVVTDTVGNPISEDTFVSSYMPLPEVVLVGT